MRYWAPANLLYTFFFIRNGPPSREISGPLANDKSPSGIRFIEPSTLYTQKGLTKPFLDSPFNVACPRVKNRAGLV